MFNFEKLTVYQKSLNLVDQIYDLTDQWPKSELFGLTSQLRRAIVSVSLNIAEGSGRTSKDFQHFISIARSSCYECVALLQIARRRKLFNEETFDRKYIELEKLSKQLTALKKSIILPSNH